MSRTLNTRPLRGKRECWVQHHDHRNGECDLLPLDEWLKLPRRKRWATGSCSWSYDWFKHVGDTRCSCDLCRDHIGHHKKNKRLRQDKLKYSQESLSSLDTD